MIAVGIYRIELPDGDEIAKVVFKGDSSEFGEIKKDTYENGDYKPLFESLPTKEEYEAGT